MFVLIRGFATILLKYKSWRRTMFIRIKTTPNSPRKSVQVVENQRDSKTGKVKQKILRHVGIALDEEEEAKLKQLGLEIIAKLQIKKQINSPQLNMFEPFLKEEIMASTETNKRLGRRPKKRIEDIIPVDQVTLDMITEENRVIDGVHEIGGYLFDFLGYNKILRNKKYSNILRDLVLCRISDPASKLATSKILKRYYAREHDVDAVYRTMDHVFDKIDAIKLCTFQATASLVPGEIKLILFDVTTLYFESTNVDELRKFGYSKDFRFNTTQVVLALATNTDGLPVGYELFEGNKAEVKTLVQAIDNWKEIFNILDVCFIGDRAMFSEPNLKELEDRNYKYIVAAKLRSLPKVMQEKILKKENYGTALVENKATLIGEFVYSNNDISTLKEKKMKANYIKKYLDLIDKNKSRKFVVSYSSKRAHHDFKKREQTLEKIEKQLDKTSNSAKLVTNTGLKKYTSNQGKSKTYIDQNKIEADARWDGIHGVITNIEGSADSLPDILAQYRRLVKIEDCFRVSKTNLKIRPIYHFKPERIHAHIAICYMAFSIVRQLEYRIKLVKKLSITSIIEELNSVQSSIYAHKVSKDRYRVPGNFSNDARKIYKAIGVERNLDARPII